MSKYNLKELLDKPVEEDMSVDSFDPWEPFQLYGSYSSEFDDMAIRVLTDIQNGEFDNYSLADEMFREMLCTLDFCEYGTSPRVCFAWGEFKDLLPQYIQKWKEYYKVQWGEDYEADDPASDLAAPGSKPTQSQLESAQGTIEDKLNDIISAAKVGEIMNRTAIAQIQAIITTETTKADREARISELEDLPYFLSFGEDLDPITDPILDKYVEERIAALQKQQPPQQEEEA